MVLISSYIGVIQHDCKMYIRARLHEPGLAANSGQVASRGPPFSSQTLVQLQAFDWKRVDPGWRPDHGWLPTRGSCKGALRGVVSWIIHLAVGVQRLQPNLMFILYEYVNV